MALQVNLQPGNVSFAGNPILVKASTSLAGTKDKTFLRIVADVTVTTTDKGNTTTFTESYTYSVGDDGQASFNVAETIKAALNAAARYTPAGTTVSQSIGFASYTILLKEVYLDKMLEIEGGSVQIGPFIGIMGQLTDYERTSGLGSDVESLVNGGLVLSRKPEGEIVYGGHPLLIPYIAGTSTTANVSVKKDSPEGTTADSASAAVSAFTPIVMSVGSQLSDGRYNIGVSPSRENYTTHVYAMEQSSDNCVSFIFVNSFGILESITASTLDLKRYGLAVDTYIEVEPFGNGLPGTLNIGGAPIESYDLTSGFVNRSWADWWCSEFLPARKVWMLQGGRYVPVIIESDGKSVVYDRSKPSLCEVKFTVRNVFSGSTMSTLR